MPCEVPQPAPRCALSILELYAGIGGCAAAVDGCAEVVAAVDQNRKALAVYRHNFGHRTLPQTVESLPDNVLAAADLWWLSPPCQPYTRRGLGRDLADRRAASWPVVLERIREHQPRYVALENVPPFRDSRARAALLEALVAGGYTVRECVLCPTELGWPNRRQRYYLVAARGPLLPWPARPRREPPGCSVAELLDEPPDDALMVSPTVLARYACAIDVVDANDPDVVTTCFTAAYGRSSIRSGSYLVTGAGLRRFSPPEILRLLGFPRWFALPSGLTAREAWPLVGNSLSVPAVRRVLSCVPELHEQFAERIDSPHALSQPLGRL
jgi:DNA (cytosine-5)-methyltransferase 1